MRQAILIWILAILVAVFSVWYINTSLNNMVREEHSFYIPQLVSVKDRLKVKPLTITGSEVVAPYGVQPSTDEPLVSKVELIRYFSPQGSVKE